MVKKILKYKTKLKLYSRDLRKAGIYSEVVLWQFIKKKQMGAIFTRQKPMGKYIVDFYCKKLNLAIEIDGCSHEENWGKDMQRQKYLETMGVRFLRFKDVQVKKDIEGVLIVIRDFIEKNK
jgi:very-short-patch-repair endonuclease